MFSSLDEKHKLLKMSQRMRERGLRLDDYTSVSQKYNRRGAVSTMTSKPSEKKDTSPFSEALY